jgi:uncharacterized membrane protein
MYSYLILVALLKSVIPHFRKNVLETLRPQDLLYINTFFICIIVSFIFIYKYFFEKKIETFTNFKDTPL